MTLHFRMTSEPESDEVDLDSVRFVMVFEPANDETKKRANGPFCLWPRGRRSAPILEIDRGGTR